MNKLTSIRIKQEDGTYSEDIPVQVLAENVLWRSGQPESLLDIIGQVDVDTDGSLQHQIDILDSKKVDIANLNSYLASQISTDVTNWLNTNVDPVGSTVMVDSSLSIEGAAADSKITGDKIIDLNQDLNKIIENGYTQKAQLTESLLTIGYSINSTTGKAFALENRSISGRLKNNGVFIKVGNIPIKTAGYSSNAGSREDTYIGTYSDRWFTNTIIYLEPDQYPYYVIIFQSEDVTEIINSIERFDTSKIDTIQNNIEKIENVITPLKPFNWTIGSPTDNTLTDRVYSNLINFEDYDNLEITFQSGDDLAFAVYSYDEDNDVYSPYPVAGKHYWGGMNITVHGKYSITIITDNSASITPYLDKVNDLIKIKRTNNIVDCNKISDIMEGQDAAFEYSSKFLFDGLIESGTYKNSHANVVSLPIDITDYDQITFNMTNSKYRYAVYNFDGEAYHVSTGGWVAANTEKTFTDKSLQYIMRVGRASGSGVLTTEEFNEIIESTIMNRIINNKVADTQLANFNLKGKKVSILGDSRSTFNGTQPEGYPYYYPHDGTNITDVHEIWWQRVIDNFDMELLANSSYSGGNTALRSGYDVLTAAASDERIAALAANNEVPDIILIYTGVNDWIHALSLGTFTPTDTIPDNYDNFSNAVIYMINQIHTNYPNADIWICRNSYSNPASTDINNADLPIPKINSRLLKSYDDRLEEIANYMSVTGVIDLTKDGINNRNIKTYATDYSTEHGLHYNIAGHKKIADMVISTFNNYYNY